MQAMCEMYNRTIEVYQYSTGGFEQLKDYCFHKLPKEYILSGLSGKRGIVKSSQGIKKVWCYSRRLLLRGSVEVKGLGKSKNCS